MRRAKGGSIDDELVNYVPARAGFLVPTGAREIKVGPWRVRINDPQCVSKTFPEYFSAFARIVS